MDASQLIFPFKQFLTKNTAPSNFENDLSELLMIHRQTELINKLEQRSSIAMKNKMENTSFSEISFSTFQNSRQLKTSRSSFELCTSQLQMFPQWTLEDCFKQVKKYCSGKTYSLLREKFRQNDEARIYSKLQKQIKYNQELVKRCLKLSYEVDELKIKLQTAMDKVRSQQKKKPVKNSGLSLQYRELILKWEKSMVYKEKVQSEIKKNLNKNFDTLQKQSECNQKIRESIEQILLKIETYEFVQNCREFEEIRHELQEQRNFWKKHFEESQSIQKEIERLFILLKNEIESIK